MAKVMGLFFLALCFTTSASAQYYGYGSSSLPSNWGYGYAGPMYSTNPILNSQIIMAQSDARLMQQGVVITQPQKQWRTKTYTEDCPHCVNGTCNTCDGKGYFRAYGNNVLCPNCERNHNGRCSHCHGSGKRTKTKTVYE